MCERWIVLPFIAVVLNTELQNREEELRFMILGNKLI